MSLIKVFFPKKEYKDVYSYKEREMMSNLILGDLLCIPIFLAFTVALFIFGKIGVFDGSISYLTGVTTLFFILSLVFVKIRYAKVGSAFATMGFLIVTFAIVFFAPTAKLPDGTIERSTFVNYRTCAFCVVIAILNYVVSMRKYQIILFHILSLVMLVISSFTVYKDIYDAQPIIMISSIVINALGIVSGNLLLQMAWKFTTKVVGHSEDARKEVEELNKSLESKVEERTHELSVSNEKLSLANKIAERDMALAVNVQRSFYPHKAPDLDGWEIAYHFNPMAGVSGDLYDFYTDGKNLEGCALFDVSGHGISSGLVTMLSKTIISREFEKGRNLPLSKVMLNINDSISNDKGDIENYLTGILLRINGNNVEYVNGGHPAMLCRSGKSGKVIPARINGEDSAGSVVGIQFLPASFTGLKFNMKSGDSLLIYTDCLYESRNAEGQEFGAENVQRIFSEAGNGTAQDQLAKVIKLFKDYTGDVPLNDDLTVMVLKKL